MTIKWAKPAALLSAVLLFAGCDTLTRSRYEMITVDVATKQDVERTLGRPTYVHGDQWHYERPDRHLNVFVDYDDSGVVARKQWIDATRGEWADTRDDPDVTRESTTVRTKR